MQPLQIQGYSGQGIKRKTPTGDENGKHYQQNVLHAGE